MKRKENLPIIENCIGAFANELNRRVKTEGPFEAAAKIIARFQILIHLL